MSLKITKFVLILALPLLGTACTPIYKTCMFGGCYGPFEIVLKAEHGEHVEDVIVELAYTEATSHGGSNIYKEYAIGNTGETLKFSRGFFSHNGVGTLDGHISHPDYERIFRPNITKQLGVIDLGTVVIESKQDRLSESIAAGIEYRRKKGISEAEINKKLDGRRVIKPGNRINYTYLAIAVSIGREDIVDKYLPDMLRTRLTEHKYDMSYEEYNERARKTIWTKAKNYE